MENKKITKKENFNALRAIALEYNREDLVEFIDHELELLTKKNSKTSTTKKDTNLELKQQIINFLVSRAEEKFTVTDLQKEMPEAQELSNQKISAVINQLAKDNIITKIIEKKKSFFKGNPTVEEVADEE